MESTSLFRGVVPFVAVAEELSFTKAARRLGVSNAALSKAVKLLEAELGVTLLQRSPRAVSLTPEGQAFLQRCSEAILALKGARQEAADARHAPQGELNISASFILAPWVTRALQPLSQRHPGLSFRLSVTDRLARFVEEDVDVAVRVGPLQDSTLGVKKLRETSWVIVGAPSYLARCGIPRTERELSSHRCLQFVPPSGKPRAWILQDPNVSISGSFFVDHGPTLIDAALSGVGVAQVLDFMVPELLASGRLIPLLQEIAQPGPEIFALFLKSRAKNANVKALLDGLEMKQR